MANRFLGFISLKQYAREQADNFGFLKKGIKEYDMSLSITERYVTEYIIRRTWQYNQQHSTGISDALETRIIFSNCTYAGMLAAMLAKRNPDMVHEDVIQRLEANGIMSIHKYVGLQVVGLHELLNDALRGILFTISENLYNNNIHLYEDPSDKEWEWNYYKDVACGMFEIGCMYYENNK